MCVYPFEMNLNLSCSYDAQHSLRFGLKTFNPHILPGREARLQALKDKTVGKLSQVLKCKPRGHWCLQYAIEYVS